MSDWQIKLEMGKQWPANIQKVLVGPETGQRMPRTGLDRSGIGQGRTRCSLSRTGQERKKNPKRYRWYRSAREGSKTRNGMVVESGGTGENRPEYVKNGLRMAKTSVHETPKVYKRWNSARPIYAS